MMKKLLAVLLSMVMAMSLMVPAFADGPDGPPPADGGSGSFTVNGAPAPACDPGDPVPLSLYLPEAVNGASFGVIGGADGPTAIITSSPFSLEGFNWDAYDLEDLDSAGWAELSEQLETLAREQRDELKRSLGGVPGQLGVMVNGEYVQFPGAAPEVKDGCAMAPAKELAQALNGEGDAAADENGHIRIFAGGYGILFTAGSSQALVYLRGTEADKEIRTVELDCAPYVKDGRAYVPVRFTAEALGCEVGWDGPYQTVILLDRDALAEKIDQDFTILNRAQANRGLTAGEGRSILSDARCGLTLTVFDTLNGDKTYKADLSGKTLANAEAVNGTYSFTMSGSALDDLEKLLISVYGKAFEEDAAQVRTVINGLEEIEVIMTREGMIWAHAPILDELNDEKNAWAAMDLGPELGALLAAQTGPATVGSMMASMVSAGSVAGWAGADGMMELLSGLCGDGSFTTVNGVSTRTIGLDDLMELYEDMGIDLEEAKDVFKEYKITVRVDGKGGATARCVMETAAQNGVPGVKLTMDSAQSAGKATLTMTIHAANIGQLELTAAYTEKASGGAPAAEPPEDAVILEVNTSALLNP